MCRSLVVRIRIADLHGSVLVIEEEAEGGGRFHVLTREVEEEIGLRGSSADSTLQMERIEVSAEVAASSLLTEMREGRDSSSPHALLAQIVGPHVLLVKIGVPHDHPAEMKRYYNRSATRDLPAGMTKPH